MWWLKCVIFLKINGMFKIPVNSGACVLLSDLLVFDFSKFSFVGVGKFCLVSHLPAFHTFVGWEFDLKEGPILKLTVNESVFTAECICKQAHVLHLFEQDIFTYVNLVC